MSLGKICLALCAVLYLSACAGTISQLTPGTSVEQAVRSAALIKGVQPDSEFSLSHDGRGVRLSAVPKGTTTQAIDAGVARAYAAPYGYGGGVGYPGGYGGFGAPFGGGGYGCNSVLGLPPSCGRR
jgi:hypothetical protein